VPNRLPLVVPRRLQPREPALSGVEGNLLFPWNQPDLVLKTEQNEIGDADSADCG
jgi:hypothetical protein